MSRCNINLASAIRMPLSSFSLKSLLPLRARQRSLVFLAAAELAPRSLPRCSNSIAVPQLSRIRWTAGFPKILELLCLKAPFARSLSGSFLREFTFSGFCLGVFLRGTLVLPRRGGIMPLSSCSLKSVFSRQRSFASSAAAELGRPALSETALKQLRRPRFVASLHGDTLATQAALVKNRHPLE